MLTKELLKQIAECAPAWMCAWYTEVTIPCVCFLPHSRAAGNFKLTLADNENGHVCFLLMDALEDAKVTVCTGSLNDENGERLGEYHTLAYDTVYSEHSEYETSTRTEGVVRAFLWKFLNPKHSVTPD